MRDETTFVADADCRKPESGRGNTGDVCIIGCSFACIAAVFHQASLRTGLLPEITAAGALQIIDRAELDDDLPLALSSSGLKTGWGLAGGGTTAAIAPESGIAAAAPARPLRNRRRGKSR